MKNSQNVREWRKNTKQKLIICMGSKCQICGYNKSLSALEFHHLDPNEKEFGIGSARSNPKSWDLIKNELIKCILVCSNCHKEIHENITEIPENFQKFDESLLQKEENIHLLKSTPISYCPICGNQKANHNKTCSKSCAGKLKSTIDWSRIDLIDLIENKKQSRNSIAKQLGCSEMNIRKRYNRLKLAPCLGFEPS